MQCSNCGKFNTFNVRGQSCLYSVIWFVAGVFLFPTIVGTFIASAIVLYFIVMALITNGNLQRCKDCGYTWLK